MLRHVVSWKLIAEDSATKLAAIGTITAALESLLGTIPQILSLRLGPNIAYPDTNWDLVLIADYDDLAGLEAYQQHPAHLAVAQIVRPLVSARSTVDFVV